ncbi:MAG: dual specificity protein phosphatase family protein [Anaerolineae bacterium]|nr:dual specificity protein phosphatase family protein [Anaerolineae bacterium]
MLNRINDWLSIGNYRVTMDVGLLLKHNVGAILELAERVEHAGIITLYLHVNDGEYLHHDIIAQGAAFIKAQHREGKHILVACGAGRSRSVTFGMAALKEISGFTLLQAYHTIYDQHPLALPHMNLLRALCDYYHEESEYETLWRDVHFNKE